MSNQNPSAMKYGMGLKTLKSYMTGLILSLVFTMCSFLTVLKHTLSRSSIFILLTVFALMQLLVQVVYFLRLNNSPEGRWNTMPFIFTLVIVAILAGGSLWIMYNLNYNMMH